MAWPFSDRLRPYVRTATWFLREGWTDEQILEWARESRASYNLDFMREALPEARRAVYFAGRIEQVAERVAAGGRDMRLSQLWGLSARSAWYAGYGRAPSDAEREWSYSRPQRMMGLALEVVGRGAHTGRIQHYTITVNADWSATVGSIMEYVRDCVSSGSCLSGDLGSEPLDASSITIHLGQGALVERQEPAVIVH